MSPALGYAGNLLRVDLSKERFAEEQPDETTLRQYVGGAGLGAKYLYEEVPPGVAWADPANRVIIASGPLGGTVVGGSGTFSLATKGPLTNGATSTQANGFLGAFLKFSGFDGIILQGVAKQWVYLYIHDGVAELRDAIPLLGKDTWETEDLVKEELGYSTHGMSVFSIGPAGENLVRFAALVGDRGHVAAHNGAGAVIGSKRLKAIAVARSKQGVKVYDRQKLAQASKGMLEVIKNDPQWSRTYKWGMLHNLPTRYATGTCLVKNYLTNIFATDKEKVDKFHAIYIRQHYEPKPHPCWACQMHHCHTIKLTEGPYAGYIGEEPEAEGVHAWGPLINNDDVAAMIMLNNEVDRLGMDTNEAGWVIAFVMECYEKGLLTAKDTDGLDMRWGNVEAARAMLHKIARRQGLGDMLAEGAMRASQRLGGEAPNMAIYTKKGNTPRGHDHRLHWPEMFDTIVSNTGTIEDDPLGDQPSLMGLRPLGNPFSPEEVAVFEAQKRGFSLFMDSLGSCKLTTKKVATLVTEMVKAATGWDFTWEEAGQAGLRAINLLRAFNIRHGHSPQLEVPSPRLGSSPVDGPAQGKSIAPVLPEMLDIYYREMGWDRASGRPLPETLEKLGLGHVVNDLWK